MDYIKQPMEIENRSMEIIAPHLEGLGLDEAAIRVYSRLIHASGDVDYANLIRMHPQVIAAAQAALQAGCDIYTDVEMVRTGINKRKLAQFGGEVFCQVAEPEIAEAAKACGVTRSMAAMRAFGEKMNGQLIAIGNAPTALQSICSLYREGRLRPEMVIGVPVGFVNVVEAKEELMQTVPDYIVARGRKGGSNVAASIVNAVLYQLVVREG